MAEMTIKRMYLIIGIVTAIMIGYSVGRVKKVESPKIPIEAPTISIQFTGKQEFQKGACYLLRCKSNDIQYLQGDSLRPITVVNFELIRR